ncbi:hypothetical protein A4X09_0g3064 [Tilletia walkeri]|uniref:Uncharacterized protein n=1 Tax=Tilletia walkeri TaxID=117179 RepID=A0A8X7T5Y2_9BASI|nr:hypothetical protein A4X09_0g3064 [Tilletia walkeri]
MERSGEQARRPRGARSGAGSCEGDVTIVETSEGRRAARRWSKRERPTTRPAREARASRAPQDGELQGGEESSTAGAGESRGTGRKDESSTNDKDRAGRAARAQREQCEGQYGPTDERSDESSTKTNKATRAAQRAGRADERSGECKSKDGRDESSTAGTESRERTGGAKGAARRASQQNARGTTEDG